MRSLLAYLLMACAAQAGDGVDPTALTRLVHQDCGSCHGMTLRGGLGPSLLPEALARYNLDAITGIILHGVPGTAMPPWSDLLTEDDAAWLADHLLSVKPASP